MSPGKVSARALDILYGLREPELEDGEIEKSDHAELQPGVRLVSLEPDSDVEVSFLTVAVTARSYFKMVLVL